MVKILTRIIDYLTRKAILCDLCKDCLTNNPSNTLIIGDESDERVKEMMDKIRNIVSNEALYKEAKNRFLQRCIDKEIKP